ncbi:hypothetical protein [Aquihabitans sp. McL0605]|uniref:hypothetical protein n=1 Tax=Aquihabitans sp. McL0605 TaxID=3415671 RepID=UPI003CFB1969
MDEGATDGEQWEHVDTPEVDWVVERTFLESNWSCIWGRGCLGIHDEPTEHLNQGCCSVGAHLDGDDEARTVAAFARMLDPALFQFHREAAAGGVFSDETATNTRVVDGACIFLNRPGFPGGAGCALHLGAEADGERPMDWKPSVCWQLPIRVDWEPLDGGRERATVRRWSRADWGPEGETMAWCCTEGERAYVGDRPVIDSLGDELVGVVGTEVYVELRRRLEVEP